MTPKQVQRLIDLVESDRNLTHFERSEISSYIRYSAPLIVLQELEQPILDLVNECEQEERFTEFTHKVRNALELLYRYQILHYA